MVQIKWHTRTIAYTPQQNGLAERFNRTLIEKVREILLDSQVTKICGPRQPTQVCTSQLVVR